MKIIHTADLHLDSKLDGFPVEKSRIRREEIVSSFENLVVYANQNKIDAIIIAGDMFDTKRVTIKTRERVIGTIKKHQNIDFLYVAGNHDEVNFLSEIDVLPQNFIIFNEAWKCVSYGDINICGINLNSANSKVVYDTLKLDQSKTNIVVMHGQVAGYNTSEKAELISIPKLKEKGIDYLALGHIHSYSLQKLDDRGEYAYSGCLEGRGFDELGEKGFVLLDCNGGKIQKEFVKFSTRELYEEEFDITDKQNLFELIDDLKENITKKYKQTSLIKIVLKGVHKADFYIDKLYIESKLQENFFFIKVVDKTELKVDLVDYEFDKSVRGEFVRSVWESNLTNEEKNSIIMCGLSALKGEI